MGRFKIWRWGSGPAVTSLATLAEAEPCSRHPGQEAQLPGIWWPFLASTGFCTHLALTHIHTHMYTHTNKNRSYKASERCPRQPQLLLLTWGSFLVVQWRWQCAWEPLGGSPPKLRIMHSWSIFTATPGTVGAFTQCGLGASSNGSLGRIAAAWYSTRFCAFWYSD